jgi:hypothetical protein
MGSAFTEIFAGLALSINSKVLFASWHVLFGGRVFYLNRASFFANARLCINSQANRATLASKIPALTKEVCHAP